MKKSSFLKILDSLVGPVACAMLSRPQGSAQRALLADTEGPVLVIRPGGMGDAVMLLPMLFALKEEVPGRRVDILCESRNEAVFKLAFPDCNTISYDRAPFATLKLLRKGGYGCVVDTEQFHNFSGVMTALTRAPLRIGFKINTNRRGLYTHLVGYDLDGAEDAQFGRLLNAACGKVVTLPRKFGVLRTINVPLVDKRDAYRTIVIHAGGSIASKRCGADVIAGAVAECAHRHGLGIVIVGGRDDAGYAAEIEKYSNDDGRGRPSYNYCGKLSLTETAKVCAEARMLVGPDSGIAHLAVALGTPAVVLFGPSDPNKWGPPEGAGKVVRVDLPCSPCSIFGYTKPCANYECVKGIGTGIVVEAIEGVLKMATGELEIGNGELGIGNGVREEDVAELQARLMEEHP